MAPVIPNPKKIRSFSTEAALTPAGRARKIAALVAMLERGETIVPEKKR